MAPEVSAEAVEAFRKYQSNVRWARSNDQKLERYAGKFVAVANGQVLESADTSQALESKYHDVPGVYVAVVVRRGLRWVL